MNISKFRKSDKENGGGYTCVNKYERNFDIYPSKHKRVIDMFKNGEFVVSKDMKTLVMKLKNEQI